MKLSKLGFTMAELLLCIAIIGIVSAMGMTITKKSTEKAYNLFYYTGYVNAYNAIADAVAAGDASMTETNGADGKIDHSVIPTLVKHFAKCFNVEESDVTWKAAVGYQISAANGITYYLYPYPGSFLAIWMNVPTSSGTSKYVQLYYVLSTNELIPGNDDNATFFQIQNRRDLLAAYVDDGKVGRNNVMNRSSWQYQRPVYGSYKDAYCSVYGASAKVSVAKLDCSTGFTNISAGRTGVIKIADPRKAR